MGAGALRLARARTPARRPLLSLPHDVLLRCLLWCDAPALGWLEAEAVPLQLREVFGHQTEALRNHPVWSWCARRSWAYTARSIEWYERWVVAHYPAESESAVGAPLFIDSWLLQQGGLEFY